MNFLDFIFPKRCVGCGKIGKYFCAACQAKIRVIELNERICPMCGRLALDGATHVKCRTKYSVDGLTSFFHYTGPVQKAIKAIKYRLVSDLSEEFIRLIPINLYSCFQEGDRILIPIPLHANRFRKRGFNQAEVVGRSLAKNLHIPIRPDILRRAKDAKPQVEMKNRKERLENMNNMFIVQNTKLSIQNTKILLFDDVFTTGATVRSAASVLKRAGARSVWAVTMAR